MALSEEEKLTVKTSLEDLEYFVERFEARVKGPGGDRFQAGLERLEELRERLGALISDSIPAVTEGGPVDSAAIADRIVDQLKSDGLGLPSETEETLAGLGASVQRMMAMLEAIPSGLEDHLTRLNDQLESMSKRLGEQDDRISAIEEALDGGLGAADERMDRQADAVTGVEVRLKGQVERLGALEARLIDLEGRVGGAFTTLASFAAPDPSSASRRVSSGAVRAVREAWRDEPSPAESPAAGRFGADADDSLSTPPPATPVAANDQPDAPPPRAKAAPSNEVRPGDELPGELLDTYFLNGGQPLADTIREEVDPARDMPDFEVVERAAEVGAAPAAGDAASRGAPDAAPEPVPEPEPAESPTKTDEAGQEESRDAGRSGSGGFNWSLDDVEFDA